jgi:hypothetical protein
MPIPDGSQLHFQITVKGEMAALGMSVTPTINLLHYRRTNSPAPVVQANVITAFHTLVKANWKAACSASWTWVSTAVRCVNDATDAGTGAVVGEVGGVAGECTPAFNVQLITKQTALRGRSYRGRVFIPSVPEGGVDGNTLTAAQLALLEAVADDLEVGFTDADGNNFVPFLLSTTQSQLVTNPTTVVGSDVVTCTAKDPVSVLRSRKARA